MAHPIGAYAARNLAKRAAREVALEHLGTRHQREVTGQIVQDALEDSPIQTSGPLADLL